MTQLNKHPLLWKIYYLRHAIEDCGCNDAVTKAVTMAGDLMDDTEDYIDIVNGLRVISEKLYAFTGSDNTHYCPRHERGALMSILDELALFNERLNKELENHADELRSEGKD